VDFLVKTKEIMDSQLQYCAKEMQAKYFEIWPLFL